MTASGVRVDPDKASKDDDPLAVGIHATAMGCIALAAMQRVLRRSRFDDRLEFMDFFRLDLGGEWSSLIETSKVLAGLILDAEADGTTTEPDATQEGLKSFRKSFLALAAHVLEEADCPEDRKRSLYNPDNPPLFRPGILPVVAGTRACPPATKRRVG